MNTANPTPITTGMTGQLAGANYVVKARLVMGMEEEGETYTWNEFLLESHDGGTATLVFEETDHGPEWKLFVLTELGSPMDSHRAASMRVGDKLVFNGSTATVTCVDESRVMHVEGNPPEWIQQGDVARYFNAVAGKHEWVVSWTGDEVECYRGIGIPGEAITKAFGVTFPVTKKHSSGWGGKGFQWGLLALIIGAATIFAFTMDSRSSRRFESLPFSSGSSSAAPRPRFDLNSSIRVGDQSFRVIGHTLESVSAVQWNRARYEYLLESEQGGRHWLVESSWPRAGSWLLLKALATPPRSSPEAEAEAAQGSLIQKGDFNGHLAYHYLSSGKQGTVENIPLHGKQGQVFHYLATNDAGGVLVASWNESMLEFLAGEILNASPTPVTSVE